MVEIPAPNLRAAQEVIDRVRNLTKEDVKRLAAAQSKTSGYFGLKRSWRLAVQALSEAREASGRGPEAERLGAVAFFAVFEALIEEAHIQGKDTSDVSGALRAYRAAYVEGGGKDTTVKTLRRAAARTFGWRMSGRIGLAGLAVSNAIAALLIWDLADASGPYTTKNRELLMRPWLRVGELPTYLSA